MDTTAFRSDISITFDDFLAVLLLLLAACWFIDMQSSILTEPDEGRYAEIPREMLAAGDWVTPRLNGITYFEKPPLQYWITAGAFELFGETAWASKLWTWASSFLGVIVILLAAARSMGARTGLIAACILASAPLYFFVGHINTLDAGLTLFMTAALAAFVTAQGAGEGTATRRRWMLLAWMSTALAVMSKGPVAIVIPALSMGIYALMERNARIFRGLSPLSGALVLAAIVAPWFVLVSRRNPGFAEFFFIHEHLVRFATTHHGRIEPWWFFAAILAGGMLPWLLPVARGWYEGLRETAAGSYESTNGSCGGTNGSCENGNGSFAPLRYLAIYAAVVVIFFSISGSKLAPYIDPAVPALSWLAAAWIERNGAVARKILPLGAAVGALLLLIAVPIMRLRMHGPAEEAAAAGFAPWVFGAGMLWLGGAHFARRFALRSSCVPMVIGMALPLVMGSQLMLHGLNAFAPTRSGNLVAEALERDGGSTRPIYAIDRYLQTVPFHLRKTVIAVGYPGELEVNLDPHTPNWLPDLSEFAVRWRRDDRPIAIVDRDRWPDVRRLGLPMRPFFSDSRVILVDKG